MQINAIAATSLQRAAETREGWTVPPGLLRRTANIALDDLRDQIQGVHTNEPRRNATLDIFDVFHRLFS